MIDLAPLGFPLDVVNALYGGCIAGGLIVGALIAVTNSWRV